MCGQNIFGSAQGVIPIKEEEMRKVLECMEVVREFTVAELAVLAKVKLEVAKEVVVELEREGIIRKVHLIQATGPRHYYVVVDKEKLRKIVGKRKRRGKISNPHWYRAKELIEEAEYGQRKLTDKLIEEIELNLKLAKEYEEMLK